MVKQVFKIDPFPHRGLAFRKDNKLNLSGVVVLGEAVVVLAVVKNESFLRLKWPRRSYTKLY